MEYTNIHGYDLQNREFWLKHDPIVPKKTSLIKLEKTEPGYLPCPKIISHRMIESADKVWTWQQNSSSSYDFKHAFD
jgi:hypothetical protein